MTAVFDRVQDVLENYKTATYEQDAEKFLSTYAADVHIYDCWNHWACIEITKWEQGVKAWFDDLREENVVLKTDFDDVVIEENDDLAFLHCRVTYAAYTQSGEKLRQMSNRFTFGLKKENGSWIIKHEHSSLPIHMETGKGIFDAK